jgi:hypothetical protein
MKKLSSAALLLALAALTTSASATWTHKLSVFAPAVKGSTTGVASVTIETAADYTIDTEQPPRVSVITPEGIVIEKVRQAPMKPEGTMTELEIEFTAAKKGRHALAATLDFTVCTKRYCEPAHEMIAFDIDVQ